MEYWEAFKHWWDSVMAAVSGTGRTHIHSNMNTHFLWEADKRKWLRLMMLQTLRKYRWFIFLQTLFLFSHLMISISVRLNYSVRSYVCTHAYTCDPSHWFWLSMIGSVMRCHKIRLIWSWARNRCQMLPASFSLPFPLSLSHRHTQFFDAESRGGEDMWSFVSVHLQCICISASALVKVNTTPSPRLDQYFLSFSICTHSRFLPPRFVWVR